MFILLQMVGLFSVSDSNKMSTSLGLLLECLLVHHSPLDLCSELSDFVVRASTQQESLRFLAVPH